MVGSAQDAASVSMPTGRANRKAEGEEFCGFIATEIFYGIGDRACSFGGQAGNFTSNNSAGNKKGSLRWFPGRLPAITNQKDAVMPGLCGFGS
jgi:hypothetical protein